MSTAYQAGVRSVAIQLGMKIAASRIDKEIASGNLQYADVMPDVPRGQMPKIMDPVMKRKMRSEMAAPAPRAPEEVSRTRALNEAVHRNQVTTSPKHVAMEQAEGHAAPPAIHNKHIQGMGPGFHPMLGVHAPDTSGQFLRSATNGTLGKLRAGVGTWKPELLPQRQPVDATLNRAVLEHELGEASEFASTQSSAGATAGAAGRPNAKGVNPFSSHLGSEPILRENLVSHGDPEAQHLMAKVRQLHPDDAYVQRLVRQMGGTPDAPIPLDSRRARALEDRLSQSATQLAPQTRQTALMRDMALDGKVRYVPEEVRETLKGMPKHIEGLGDAVQGKRFGDTLRGLGDLRGAGKRLQQFVTRGH